MDITQGENAEFGLAQSDAPFRHPIAWQDPEFYDEAAMDAEMRRIFDICHGCRRCFNLCDSFPRLFNLIDDTPLGELEEVPSVEFKKVVDACTLCDLCFMTKCPYVPPHEFNLDFPHLMLRYRAIEFKKGQVSVIDQQLVKTDRNGKIGTMAAPLVNWASDVQNKPMRQLMEKTLGIHLQAALPQYQGKTFTATAQKAKESLVVNQQAPAFGEKVVLYATCLVNYHHPSIGRAAQQVLAHNGIETEIIYPECCGMPQLEQGNIASVAKKAEAVADVLMPWIDKGYAIIALVPSCALMLKFEWPLIVPKNAAIEKLSRHSFDLSEYIVRIAKTKGLTPGLTPLTEGVTVHIACHARAQNMGRKAAEMLQLIPQTPLTVIERCSGHGGSWGVKENNFDIALKLGKPVVTQTLKAPHKYITSECPLAGTHIQQGLEKASDSVSQLPIFITHPIELLARSYNFI